MPSIEVTTRIGCRVMCSYCPQDKILDACPDLRQGGHMMSLETFEKCLEHLPREVNIHFSGFAEAWLNPACTDMVLEASARGHRLVICTTLVGMTLDDVERLEPIKVKKFSIHLPADDDLMQVAVDDTYVAVLERLLDGPLGVKCKFHGERMNPQVAKIVKHGRRARLHTRAGQVEIEDQSAPRWLRGEITCRRDPVQHVLLPSGEIVLCCMDWSMKHRLGNLRDMDYESLIAGPPMQQILAAWKDESQDILCRVCDRYAANVDLRAKVYNDWLPRLSRALGR